MARVEYSPEARDDLVGVTDFIAAANPAAAWKSYARIRETCQTIATHPEMGELRDGFGVPGCRSFSVGNYVIFFRQIDDGVEVARIIHGSRDMRNI